MRGPCEGGPGIVPNSSCLGNAARGSLGCLSLAAGFVCSLGQSSARGCAQMRQITHPSVLGAFLQRKHREKGEIG